MADKADLIKQAKEYGLNDADLVDHTKQQLEEERASALLTLQEREDIMTMRKAWSYVILVGIALIIVVDFVIIFLVGFGLMSFTDQWAIPAIVADSIIKVIGLAMIVVNFLFNKDSLSK